MSACVVNQRLDAVAKLLYSRRRSCHIATQSLPKTATHSRVLLRVRLSLVVDNATKSNTSLLNNAMQPAGYQIGYQRLTSRLAVYMKTATPLQSPITSHLQMLPQVASSFHLPVDRMHR
ncbi:hypothetical protein PILCRDRAFT_12250 [Piloderma croceum F 1598]|uniref:Uncharacterized protein n=1 Tax=Piloderma croceum (strain F 1598) TaxID=765440 RepID=A0A0C3FB18_PILCF|nr:hypothetical protein PILCRDRAFT_12250 [Piloderma croceum F 1598]